MRQQLSLMMMHLVIACLFFQSCKKETIIIPLPPAPSNPTSPTTSNIGPASISIRAVDLSFLSEIELAGIKYKNNGEIQDPLLTLKNAGCNYVRLRLWHTPTGPHSSLAEVKKMTDRIRLLGMKVWLCVHYSDSWADPGKQTKPDAWRSMNFSELKLALEVYTAGVVNEIKPDLIQIGNEINDGFLWPDGKITTNELQFVQLMQTAVSAVRKTAAGTKIMIHFAGMTGSDWFYNKLNNLDYDYIGISYYPIHHGALLEKLGQTIKSLTTFFSKKLLVAEVAYPFTLGWNDWTNNIVGLTSHLVSGYDATPDGQKRFLEGLRKMIGDNGGIGFCYWGGEWIAFKGPQASNGSPWENQALWDFEYNALPAVNVFKEN
ncbi:MAG: glycoside hydrolase family 53 protein [Chitinophagaceae bacterium]